MSRWQAVCLKGGNAPSATPNQLPFEPLALVTRHLLPSQRSYIFSPVSEIQQKRVYSSPIRTQGRKYLMGPTTTSLQFSIICRRNVYFLLLSFWTARIRYRHNKKTPKPSLKSKWSPDRNRYHLIICSFHTVRLYKKSDYEHEHKFVDPCKYCKYITLDTWTSVDL